MTRKRLILWILLLTPACVIPRLDVRPAVGDMSLHGKFGANSSGSSATSSFTALGLTGDETVFQPRVDLDWIGPHIAISALNVGFSGSGTTQAAIELDNETIDADVDVNTDLDIEAYRMAFTWDVLPTGMFEGGIGLGATILGLDLMMEAPSVNRRIETDETFPIPTLSARAAFRLGRWGASLDLGYLDFSASDVDVAIFDYELAGTVDLVGSGQRLAARLMVGYRGLDIAADYEDGNDQAQLEFLLDGLMYGLVVSF
jgi:hypothetical protein